MFTMYELKHYSIIILSNWNKRMKGFHILWGEETEVIKHYGLISGLFCYLFSITPITNFLFLFSIKPKPS